MTAPTLTWFTQVSDAYAGTGIGHSIPLPAGEKFPPPWGYTGRNGAVPGLAERAQWSDRTGNVGLRLNNEVVALDVDHYGDKRGRDHPREARGPSGPAAGHMEAHQA